MSDSQEHDERAMRTAYREATAQLDERPHAGVRDAVLAAATAAADGRASSNPFRRGRWPLSMAAVLVTALMVGLVVDRAVDEAPDRVAGVAGAGREAAPVTEAASGGAVVAEDRSAPVDRMASAPAQAAPVAPATRRAAVPREPMRDKVRDSRAPAPAPTRDAARSAITAAGDAQAPAPAAKAETSAPTAVAPVAPADAIRERSSDHSSSSPLARTQAKVVAETPQAWAERIVRLREAGRDEDADREVSALRRSFPAFTVPAAALAASGR